MRKNIILHKSVVFKSVSFELNAELIKEEIIEKPKKVNNNKKIPKFIKDIIKSVVAVLILKIFEMFFL